MAQETRTQIKTYFETGDVPTQAQLQNMLDSTLWYDDPASFSTQTASYVLTLTDNRRIIRMNSAASNTVTVPPHSSVAFPIGAIITVRQIGVGATTIAAGAGVTINAASLNVGGQYAAIGLMKIAVNEWDLYASGAAAGDTTSPFVISATAISATVIRVVFSEVVTATSAGWTFKKNGAAHNPTAISGSGTATLDFTVPPMIRSDTILRSYSEGTGDTLDAASNELVAFTDSAVTNSAPHFYYRFDDPGGGVPGWTQVDTGDGTIEIDDDLVDVGVQKLKMYGGTGSGPQIYRTDVFATNDDLEITVTGVTLEAGTAWEVYAGVVPGYTGTWRTLIAGTNTWTVNNVNGTHILFTASAGVTAYAKEISITIL